MQGLIKLLS